MTAKASHSAEHLLNQLGELSSHLTSASLQDHDYFEKPLQIIHNALGFHISVLYKISNVIENDLILEVASVFKGELSEVENGKYDLIFETGMSRPKPWCRFTFVRRNATTARILKGREHLKPPEQLIMTAEPA